MEVFAKARSTSQIDTKALKSFLFGSWEKFKYYEEILEVANS